MHVLVIKTSSLGDIIHTFPALSDAAAAIPGIRFDWAAEPAYEAVCRWHPSVTHTIAVPYRQWRHSPFSRGGLEMAAATWRRLRARRYDRVIDAQGLLKSGLFAALTRGPRHGLDFRSVSEWPAALVYNRRHHVPVTNVAVERCRRLFAAALGYPMPATVADFGLEPRQFGAPILPGRYLVFNHGTSWPTKSWAVSEWRELARLATQAGFRICLPWHDAEDQARAKAIAAGLPLAAPLELNVPGVARALAGASGAVGVETAFSHLAAALGIPTVTLFGPTGPRRHGTSGQRAVDLTPRTYNCSPCYGRSVCKLDRTPAAAPPCMASFSAAQVWRTLMDLSNYTGESAMGAGE